MKGKIMGILEGMYKVADSVNENREACLEVEKLLRNYLNEFCSINDVNYFIMINNNYSKIEKEILLNAGIDNVDNAYNIKVLLFDKDTELLGNNSCNAQIKCNSICESYQVDFKASNGKTINIQFASYAKNSFVGWEPKNLSNINTFVEQSNEKVFIKK